MSALGVAPCPCGGEHFVLSLGPWFLGPFATVEQAQAAARSLGEGIDNFGPMLGVESPGQLLDMMLGEGEGAPLPPVCRPVVR